MSIIFKQYDKRGDLQYEKEEDFEPVTHFRDSYLPKVAPIIKEAPYIIGGSKGLGKNQSSGILNQLADDQRSFRTRKSGHDNGSPAPHASSTKGSPPRNIEQVDLPPPELADWEKMDKNL